MSAPTPRPWVTWKGHLEIHGAATEEGITENTRGCIANSVEVARFDDWATSESTARANMRLVLRAVNHHDALVALARKVAAHFEDTDAPLGIDARALLQRIDGVQP